MNVNFEAAKLKFGRSSDGSRRRLRIIMDRDLGTVDVKLWKRSRWLDGAHCGIDVIMDGDLEAVDLTGKPGLVDDLGSGHSR